MKEWNKNDLTFYQQFVIDWHNEHCGPTWCTALLGFFLEQTNRKIWQDLGNSTWVHFVSVRRGLPNTIAHQSPFWLMKATYTCIGMGWHCGCSQFETRYQPNRSVIILWPYHVWARVQLARCREILAVYGNGWLGLVHSHVYSWKLKYRLGTWFIIVYSQGLGREL